MKSRITIKNKNHLAKKAWLTFGFKLHKRFALIFFFSFDLFLFSLLQLPRPTLYSQIYIEN